jgi:hypothetical protein
MKVVISEVLNGNTFKVSPEWLWDFNEGDTVKALGYRTPQNSQTEFEKAVRKMKKLLLGKTVELANPVNLTEEGQLLCDVLVDGKNVAEFFPEYR